MSTVATFVCDCGTRLKIVTESEHSHEYSIIPCPNAKCRTRHFVSGPVLQVFVIDANDNLKPYDWKTTQPPATT